MMIFDEILNAVHFITQIKIAPNMKEDIYIPELERIKGSEIASKLHMSSLGLIWQVLFKGYVELQQGFHLLQHGEMIILRLIYISEGPSPEDLIKKNIDKKKNENDSLIVDHKVKREGINKNETINADQTKERYYTNLSITKAQSSLVSYREFVDLFFQQKEPILHSQLYNKVKLISFEEGKIVLNIESIKEPNFTRRVGRLISKWTGRIWQIYSSNSNVGKSLYEEDLINQQKEIEKIKNNPEMKEILVKFPNSKIHSITTITESSDESDHNIGNNIERTSDG